MNPQGHGVCRKAALWPFPSQTQTRTGQMKELLIDIETYSSINLAKCGVYRYTEADDFRIVLFGYSVDMGPVMVVDLASGERIPDDIIKALTDDAVLKYAYNAAFERVCLSRHLGMGTGTYLSPESWRCLMVHAATLALPQSLKDVGRVMNLAQGKMDEGRALIRLFCGPVAPTARNGWRTRNTPSDLPEEWALFKEYNRRDVEVELEVQRRLERFPVPEGIWHEYSQSEEVNDRGVMVDRALIARAIEDDRLSQEEIVTRMKELSGLENPGSVQQLKTWLQERGVVVESLGRKQVEALLEEVPPQMSELLELRIRQARSAVKKYQAMENAACSDSRIRGCFRFGGAARTLRFASRIVQLQNLARNHMEDLDGARNDVLTLPYEALSRLYDDVPDTLSQLVRTAFIPAPGNRFIVSDFSAIEARVLSWLANETWRLDVFRNGGDIYSATASRMFGVPVAKHGPNAELRQKGKQAELACGYGGSVGALKAMGALEMGMKEEELKPLVDSWRQASPQIVALWNDVGRAAMKAVRERGSERTHGLVFSYEAGFLFIRLPSGRRLAYVKPKVEDDENGRSTLTYEGTGLTKAWERIRTFGGKLVENIVQATSRDILCFAMQNMRDLSIVMHIHDEVVIEAPPELTVDEIVRRMTIVPPWAEGLVMDADGYECAYYRKD